MRPFIFISLAAAALAGCHSEWQGYEQLDNGWYRRLDRFGNGEGLMDTCKYVLLSFGISNVSDTSASEPSDIYSGWPADSSGALHEIIAAMESGEAITIGMPWQDFSREWLAAFTDSSGIQRDGWIRLRLEVVKVFNQQQYLDHLQSAAQQGEMEEHEAIELALIHDWPQAEQHGKLTIIRQSVAPGDSVAAGREVHIRYNSYLLNGVRLDPLTEMVFPFGRPGQLIPGLQYGLSFLREGERALIFMPSYLAFGEQGSSTGIVPPHTPVYFDVEVMGVNAPLD